VSDIGLGEDGFGAQALEFDFKGLTLRRSAAGNNQTSK
jgi:hypothetical protein